MDESEIGTPFKRGERTKRKSQIKDLSVVCNRVELVKKFSETKKHRYELAHFCAFCFLALF